MTRINNIDVNSNDKTMMVGPGTTWIEVYKKVCIVLKKQIVAHRLVTKYLSSPSTLNVNIYKTALYGDEKSSVTIQILWCQFLDSEPFQILKRILKLMQITSVFSHQKATFYI